MRLIGLTGGIGSGKSTVAGIFRTIGIPVYESDSRAKMLMDTDATLKHQIISSFGPEAYTKDNTLNSQYLASKVFTDRNSLEKLNSIVHPAVYQDILAWSSFSEQTTAPYLLQESAIIFEENLTDRLAAVILVVADKEIRVARVMERDQNTRKEIENRMDHQWNDAKKIQLADYVIYNDNERSLIRQVMDIDLMIRNR